LDGSPQQAAIANRMWCRQSFRYNPDLGTIDVGGHHVATTKKYRDVQFNGWAAIVVDDLVSTNP